MKILIINGSPHENDNIAIRLGEMERIFTAEGIETEQLQVGHIPIRGCIGCRKCKIDGRCILNDIVNETTQKFRECDGLVVATPVYYAGANATLTAFMTRLFYSTLFDKRMKVGACVTTARRNNAASAVDEINKFFAISGMPIASGQYGNGIHDNMPDAALQDEADRQMIHSLARNMVFLMKSIALGGAAYEVPQREARIRTNFIR